jgi:hypothetical protein
LQHITTSKQIHPVAQSQADVAPGLFFVFKFDYFCGKIGSMAVKEQQKQSGDTSTGFAFGRQNYILVITGLVVMGIGFILMIGGGSDDPNEFSYALFNFQRLTLAPVLILAGYIIEIFAILKRPKPKH